MTHGLGEYLTELRIAELSHFLGREPYERKEGESNHRNGSCERQFTMKRFGEVTAKVPRDREGEFQSDVLTILIILRCYYGYQLFLKTPINREFPGIAK